MPKRSDELLAPGAEVRRPRTNNPSRPNEGRFSRGAVRPTESANCIDDREYVSITEAVRITSLGRTKLYELMNRGQLEYAKIDRRRIIRRSSISALGGR